MPENSYMKKKKKKFNFSLLVKNTYWNATIFEIFKKQKKENKRQPQDSNLCGHSPRDFKSHALTARPDCQIFSKVLFKISLSWRKCGNNCYVDKLSLQKCVNFNYSFI